ncbi:hypothetical protein GGR53DRAFT_313212 [Hypoxylon sp. FL1150]|nr:hypothetical protein GGR53DRAFT_313212 [Hypoxylon sp. FL1150]
MLLYIFHLSRYIVCALVSACLRSSCHPALFPSVSPFPFCQTRSLSGASIEFSLSYYLSACLPACLPVLHTRTHAFPLLIYVFSSLPAPLLPFLLLTSLPSLFPRMNRYSRELGIACV